MTVRKKTAEIPSDKILKSIKHEAANENAAPCFFSEMFNVPYSLQFMYLLNEKDLHHLDIFEALLEQLYKNNPSFDSAIPMYRKCLVALDVALLNANYGIRKLHKVKKQKVNTYTWDEIMKS